jgi:hypothetical protein
MKNESTISEELREISPFLAGLTLKEDLFKVPDGYFDQLPSLIMRRIASITVNEELQAIAPVVHAISKGPVFTVPAGYFDQFPSIMLGRLEKAEAKEELEMLSPLLGRLEKSMPFSTPEGYFSAFADQLTTGMQASSLVDDEKLSPLMTGLKQSNPFEVPMNYFEGLPQSILNRAMAESKTAKLVSFSIGNAWLKYAAAAVLTGVLITIGLFTFNKHNASDPLSALAKVSDQEMVNYIENHDISMIDSTNFSTASVEWGDNDVKELLEDVPDAELQQYVNDASGTKEMITN